MAIQFIPSTGYKADTVIHPVIANKLKQIKYPGIQVVSTCEEICEMFWRDTIVMFGFLLNTPEYRGQTIGWAEFAAMITRYSTSEKAHVIAEILYLSDRISAMIHGD